MKTIRFHKAEEFIGYFAPFSIEEEAIHNMFISQLNALKKTKPSEYLLLLVEDESQNQMAIIKSKDKDFLFFHRGTYFDLLLPALIHFFIEKKISISGLLGPSFLVEQFCSLWIDQNPTQKISLVRKHILYQLDEVIFPTQKTKGKLRKATPQDIDLLSDWVDQFHQEALGEYFGTKNWEITVQKVRQEALFVWETEELVSMIGKARETANGATISLVYTPHAFRKKGFALASTAAFSAYLLAQEKKQFCTLFTDLENPSTNRLYQKVGYYPIGKFRNVRFESIEK